MPHQNYWVVGSQKIRCSYFDAYLSVMLKRPTVKEYPIYLFPTPFIKTF